MSGMTRSMPNISSSGNIRPQSMTTMSSPYSKTYMFLPISPTPPSGMMRSGWSSVVAGMSVPVVGWSEEGQLGVGRRSAGVGDELRSAAASAAGLGAPMSARVAIGGGGESTRRSRVDRDAAARSRRSPRRRAARPGPARCRRSSRARWPACAARRPGGTSRRPARRGRRSPGRPARIVPWACEIRAPGMNRPIEWRPSVTTTAGSSTSSWRRRYGAQAAISSGSRVAVVGRPALDDVGDEDLLAPPADRGRAASTSRSPARPTNGRPCAVLVEARALADEDDLGRRDRPRRARPASASRGAGSRVQARTSAAIASSAAGARRRSRRGLDDAPTAAVRAALHASTRA